MKQVLPTSVYLFLNNDFINRKNPIPPGSNILSS